MAATSSIDFQPIFDATPTPLVLLTHDLVIADMNVAYTDAVERGRDALIGRNVFDAFPATGDTERKLKASLTRVLRTGQPDFLPLIHYPIPIPDESGITDRYWSVTHSPILSGEGDVAFILQNTQDVTELHRLKTELGGRSDGESEDIGRGDIRHGDIGHGDIEHGDTENGERGRGKAALGSSILERAERVQALNKTLLDESTQLRNLFMRSPSFMCVLRGPELRFELANTPS